MAPLQVVERLFSEERARSYDDALFVGIDEVVGRKGKASKGNRNVAVTNSAVESITKTAPCPGMANVSRTRALSSKSLRVRIGPPAQRAPP
jgi:hypothetical protein